MKQTGSVIIEATLGAFILFLFTFLLLELWRLSLMHLSLEQATFIYVRKRAFGSSKERAETQSRQYLEKFWGHPVKFPLDFKESHSDDKFKVSMHIRFPQFLKVQMGSYFKHHLEVTKACHFPG